MPEQEEKPTEKKKAKIVVEVLRWLSFGLISFLLILSVIFQGPWKVTTLLGILAVGIILPKPYGKYFWLCVCGVLVALIVWVFLPEETEGWQPYTFDKELAELQAKYAVPDSENAAIIYSQLLKDYNEAAYEPNFADSNLEDLIRYEPWASRDHPEAAEWLKQQEGTIAKLIEASKVEECRFPIDADIMGNSGMLDRLSAMKRWAHLLSSAANNDLGDGRINQALEKQIAVVHMVKHQYQQPSLTDVLVGAGIEIFSTNQLKRFIIEGDATEKHLDLIEKALAKVKHDWGTDLPRILDYEKLVAKNFCGMFYEINLKGKTRLNPGEATRVMTAQLPEDVKEKFVITYWRGRLIKASTIWAWFYMPSTPQKAGEIINSEYEKLYAMADPDFNWAGKPAKMLTFNCLNYRYLVVPVIELVPVYGGTHDIYLRNISQQRGILLTIALRRYKNKTGYWPESLDEVKSLAAEEIFVDPMNGGSFIYKLMDGNFELYSRGKNNVDENGQYNKTCDPNSGECKIKEDDLPVWPPIGTKRRNGEGGVR
jgi:hypothetical protein